jgi:L-iditol 2-dehydrogenase
VTGIPEMMRAAIFHAPGDVRVERVPVPAPEGGDVLVRIEAATTCGTDAKAFLRGHPILLGPAPARFGHEYAGVVAAVGPDAAFVVGDRVAGANSAPCGACASCRRGEEALCLQLQPLLNGSYAEYLLVPGRIAAVNLHVLAPGLPAAIAAMCEPLACAIAGVDAAGIEPGESVAVLGRGGLGRMLGSVAESKGARVTLLGRDSPDPAEAPDRVIEAAGTTAAWRRATDLVRRGGTIVFFGGCPAGSTVELDTYRLHYDALTLRGVFHHTPALVRRALDLLAEQPERFASLVTHRFALEDLLEPIARTCGILPRDGLVKAAIVP